MRSIWDSQYWYTFSLVSILYLLVSHHWKLLRHSLNWVNCLCNCVNLYNPGSSEVPLLDIHQNICWVLLVRHHNVEFQLRAIPCHKLFFIEVLCSYSPSFHVVVLQFATIDLTVHSMAPLTYGVTMHCNRSDTVYKAGSEQKMLMIFKFSGLSTLTSGYSLCKNGLICFKNEASDISCFMSIMYWAADQKFVSFNTLITKTSFACRCG